MVWVRNVFLKYGFGCERSFWNMVWVRNVFLIYKDGGETSFLFILFMGRGRNVFPEYELGAKRLTKKWCELTMGRKVCVPRQNNCTRKFVVQGTMRSIILCAVNLFCFIIIHQVSLIVNFNIAGYNMFTKWCYLQVVFLLMPFNWH